MTDYSFTTEGTITRDNIIKFDFDVTVRTNNSTLMSFLDEEIDKLINDFCKNNNFKRRYCK